MREHYICDTEVNLCYSRPCGEHGTCMRKEGGYTCVCLPGYTGKCICWYSQPSWYLCIWLFHILFPPLSAQTYTAIFLCNNIHTSWLLFHATGKNCEVNMLSGPCVAEVCKHGSKCTAVTLKGESSGGFTCTNCSRSLYHTSTCELRARRFSKGTFLTFPALKQRHRLNIKIR